MKAVLLASILLGGQAHAAEGQDAPVAGQVAVGAFAAAGGAVVGGGLGGLLASGCTNEKDANGNSQLFDCSFGGFVIGAGVGAVLGAGVGIAAVGNTGPGEGSYAAAIGGTAGGALLGVGATGLIALAIDANKNPGWVALSANVLIIGGGLAGGVIGYKLSHTDDVTIVPTATAHGGGLAIAGQF